MIWFLNDPWVPKGNIGARQAGVNKTGKKSSETKGNNQGKPPKFFAACYECAPISGYPPTVPIQSTTRRTVCKQGHVLNLR